MAKKEEPESGVSRLAHLVEDYIVSSIKEAVGDIAESFKRKVNLNLKIFSALVVIAVGLIYILSGLAMILNKFFGTEGLGHLVIGIIVVIVGIFVAELSKSKLND